MAKREAFLASEDVGSSLDAVEALIKKHEDFDKSLQAQVSHVLHFHSHSNAGHFHSHSNAGHFHSHFILVYMYSCPIPMLNCRPTGGEDRSTAGICRSTDTAQTLCCSGGCRTEGQCPGPVVPSQVSSGGMETQVGAVPLSAAV